MSDEQVQAEFRRLSRRGFAAWLAGGGLGVAGLAWVATCERDDRIPWPLRRALQWNEDLWDATYAASALAREFPQSAAREPRVNGRLGMQDAKRSLTTIDAETWRMTAEGFSAEQPKRQFSLGEIQSLPRYEHTTELMCIEGWSAVVTWAGARLCDFAAQLGLATRDGQPRKAVSASDKDVAPYVSLETPDGKYFVGLDIASALHPQTLLCYEMNGQPLTNAHGAPLRLVIPVKYGVKSIKRIGRIRFTAQRPADYWAERGYDWYAGL